MVAYARIKKFRDFLGVDLKSTDIKRTGQYASGGRNVDFTPNNSIVKRRGYQFKTSTGFNAGLATYAKVDLTGIPAPELISIGTSLRKLTTSSLDIAYIGPDEARLSFALDSVTLTYHLILIQDNVEMLDFDCGTTQTVADLITAITGVFGWTATSTGDTSQPAEFIDIYRESIITSVSLPYSYFTDINSGNVLMTANTSEQGQASYENPAFANFNNVFYITNRIDGLFKYDGQTFYKAGMPGGSINSIGLGGAGPLNGAYSYHVTYIQIDNAGQVTEGNASEISNVSPAGNDVNITVDNILAASGFNTNAAIVAGAQVGVNTITVDDGSAGTHSLKVGDTAYFFDITSSQYVTREITAVTAATITIAGATVQVADNAPISNNLRIALYRTLVGGVTRYFLEEIPNDPYSATQVYVDSTVDSSLGAAYVTPRYGHDEPPKCQYLTTYRNLLILAGSEADPSRFYWSDSDGPELFSLASHASDINTMIGDVITGVGVNNDQLCIFKDQSIFVGAGDFANLNFVIDQLTSGDLGCVSHHSIQEVREGVLYFLTSRGPYRIVGGQLPSPVGPTISDLNKQFSRIESYFTEKTLLPNQVPKLKRSVAINFPDEAKYLLFIPTEDSDGTANANSNSIVWVFDYSRGAWLPNWTNVNAAGGIAVFDNTVHFTERTTSTRTAKFLDTNDEYDFADHNLPVDFVYEDNWEHLGEPNIKKKFLRLTMMVLDEVESANWNLTVEMGIEFYKNLSLASLTVPFGQADAVGWGDAGWGEFPWGEPLNVYKKIKLKSNKTRAMRIIFKNNELHKNILLTGWELQVAAPYRAID